MRTDRQTDILITIICTRVPGGEETIMSWSPGAVGVERRQNVVGNEWMEESGGESFQLDGEASWYSVPIVIAYTASE